MHCLIVPLLLTMPLLGQSTTQKKPKPPKAGQAAIEMSFSVLLSEAKRGDCNAQFQLGKKFEFGIDIYKDDVEAVRWYQQAANQGHGEAQYYLGLCYGAGVGVTKNDAEAMKWFRKAAEQGEPKGQQFLGHSYALGNGVPQNYAEAYVWLSLATANGLACTSIRDAMARQLSPQALERAQERARKLHEEIQARMGRR